MKVNIDCIHCTRIRAEKRLDEYSNDPMEKLVFIKELYCLIGNAPLDISAPYLSKKVDDLFKKYFKIVDEFSKEKDYFNELVMGIEEDIQKILNNSTDPLLDSLKFTLVGNLIDFGAMSDVSTEHLLELVDGYKQQVVDKIEYINFKKELQNSKKLVYLLDNAGEIVFDKLCIQTIKRLYPDIQITAITRGFPTINDVTMKDAVQVGLDKLVEVVDNGTDIPGTELSLISDISKERIMQADLILSKGQGNFETLHESGLNIYYLFLCKCDLFAKQFGVKKYSGMFVNELRMQDIDL